jgi:hypothetical protein
MDFLNFTNIAGPTQAGLARKITQRFYDRRLWSRGHGKRVRFGLKGFTDMPPRDTASSFL